MKEEETEEEEEEEEKEEEEEEEEVEKEVEEEEEDFNFRIQTKACSLDYRRMIERIMRCRGKGKGDRGPPRGKGGL